MEMNHFATEGLEIRHGLLHDLPFGRARSGDVFDSIKSIHTETSSVQTQARGRSLLMAYELLLEADGDIEIEARLYVKSSFNEPP